MLLVNVYIIFIEKKIDANSLNCSHYINMIISPGLNEMLVYCHPTLIYQLRLVDWREVCFAWPQPLDRFSYLFLLLHLQRW